MVKYILILSLLFAFNTVISATVLVDPTKPLNYKVKTIKKVTRSGLPELQSILGERGKRRVILNNKLYKQGQWVNGYSIKSIKKDSVLLSYRHKLYELSLYQKLSYK